VTNEQLIRVVTRALAIFLVVWAISDAIELPRSLLTLMHEFQRVAFPSVAITGGLGDAGAYYLRYSIIGFAGYVLRITLWLKGAQWLYRCGPWLQNFFGVETKDEQTASLDR
jgi:hypothetical protein